MANTRLTSFQVAQVAAQAGFGQAIGGGLKGAATGENSLEIAVAISFAEDTTHDVAATHHNSDGSTDYGLWQINSVHSQYDPAKLTSDPLYNAQAAYAISNQGTNFGAWTTYKSGAYLAFLPAAKSAVRDANDHETGVQSFAVGVSNAASTLGSWTKYAAKLLANLTSASFWKRIGFGLIGVVLLIFALLLIFRPKHLPVPVPV